MLSEINNRIKQEICYHTLHKLNDDNLLSEYKKQPSVIKEISILNNTLDKNGINNETKNNIINDYIPSLIPPGTKGVIRGNTFNNIVKDYFGDLKKDSSKIISNHIDSIYAAPR